MIQPPLLQKGEIVGLVATGRKLDADTVRASAKIIESWGLRVRLGKNIFSNKHSYLAGSDEERLQDLQSMLDDATVHAIICARGGYGTTRILDQLNFDSFLKKPKWICGFSDITALHLKLQALNVQSIHGTMPVLFTKTESSTSLETLRKTLLGESMAQSSASHHANKIGEGSGNLIGGNLSLILDSLGTSTEINTKNKILVIEEVDEHLYRIDRMLVQLNRAGKFNALTGLAVGHMSDLKDTDLPFGETVEQIILNHVQEFNFPVGFGFPVGHINPNFSWIEGSQATLRVTQEKSSITFP